MYTEDIQLYQGVLVRNSQNPQISEFVNAIPTTLRNMLHSVEVQQGNLKLEWKLSIAACYGEGKNITLAGKTWKIASSKSIYKKPIVPVTLKQLPLESRLIMRLLVQSDKVISDKDRVIELTDCLFTRAGALHPQVKPLLNESALNPFIGEYHQSKNLVTLSRYSAKNPVKVGRWEYVNRQYGEYPLDDEDGGKWLIFAPYPQLQPLWRLITIATQEGLLGSSAKVSTRKNPTDQDGVICVYTYSLADKPDLLRVRGVLGLLGIQQELGYKTNAATKSFQYGDTAIAFRSSWSSDTD